MSKTQAAHEDSYHDNVICCMLELLYVVQEIVPIKWIRESMCALFLYVYWGGMEGSDHPIIKNRSCTGH